jgi:hypothetical protein
MQTDRSKPPQLLQQLVSLLLCSTLLLLLLVPAEAGKPRDESKGKWR